ncbi:MAG: ECF transporter S component [Clostridia bacterium]
MNRKKTDIKKLVQAGVLTALIVVMTVVPYTGYIYYGLIEITTLHIVVAIGAVMLGWQYGAYLGLVWGVTCMFRALTNPLWAPFVNPLISVIPRICVGAVAGWVAAFLRKKKCKPYVTASLSAAVSTITNTVLVLSALKLFSAALTGAPLLGTIYATLIGVNGLIELVAAIVIVPAVLAAIQPRELILGIDIGASTTKMALVRRGNCIKAIRKPEDVSLEQALCDFGINGVKRIVLTGVGASYITNDLLGIPTIHADEFLSLSRGATRCAKKRNCLIVSVGTGTSFTRVTPIRSWHVGGTGLGGGMMQGLAKCLCGTGSMDELQTLAAKGNLHNIDLQLQDVCEGTISNLQPTSTVANLSKSTEQSSREDLAAGLCNLIFQAIGVMAAFAVQKHMTRTIVLVGTITDWPIAKTTLSEVAALHKVRFIVPDNAAFATAIGAAME